MTTALDLALIQDYTGGVNMPIASQAGYDAHVDANGTNLEYRSKYQTISGSGTWDGVSPVILVTGSGARSIALPIPSATGQRKVQILDADGTSSAGAIVITFTGATLGAGTPAILSNYNARSLTYLGSNVWTEA